MDKHNIFDNLPRDLTLEQFEPLLKTDTVLIERIISAAHVTPEG
ncbi:MAG: cupin 2 domain-containing protein [Shewanella sp.]|jgi:cupin 2 domain-containing protein